MVTRRRLWHLVDRLTSFVPSGPTERRSSLSRPDPNEPGISERTRRARMRMIGFRHGKPKK